MTSGRATEVNATAETGTPIVAHTLDLFESLPVLVGRWPAHHSLEGRFLARILNGEKLTAGDWLRAVHSMRLSAEVDELGKLGWTVRRKLEAKVTRDRGRRAHVARYWLDERQRDAAIRTDRAALFIDAVEAFEQGRGGSPVAIDGARAARAAHGGVQ